jgi:GTPase
MKKLFGNLKGLKPNQIHRLENLYRRRVPAEFLATPELARDLAGLSHEINRQIGLLINRSGKIAFVVVGSFHDILIPETHDYRSAPDRLKGLRCFHTHLDGDGLSRDDLTDLALLRLDMMAALTLRDGEPHQVSIAHILPGGPSDKPYEVLAPKSIHQMDMGCLELISALEAELTFSRVSRPAGVQIEKALLISVTSASRTAAADSIEELKDLALSGGVEIAGTLIQHRTRIDPKYLMGAGKIKELAIMALQKGATLLIFDQELSPSQIRSITDQVEMKVIDRSQLILDIFAQRAQTREGKLQVELAQLKYLLPRLVVKNTAMSRLTGGIGGRGPGETKLENNRRRVRDRIVHLEASLDQVRKQRKQQKAKRQKKSLPVISIIGYTNAGKSTLLNSLTHSSVLAESRLFATLDPSSRRLRFPKDVEVIITDTVGFIRDLPNDLQVAFRATLEELENADLLLHVMDIGNPRFKEQMDAVNKILEELNLNNIPTIYVLNKMDLANRHIVDVYREKLDAIPISAIDRSTLGQLVERMQAAII